MVRPIFIFVAGMIAGVLLAVAARPLQTKEHVTPAPAPAAARMATSNSPAQPRESISAPASPAQLAQTTQPVQHTQSDTPTSAVLRIANEFPNGGGFNWDNGSGTPDEIRFKGQKILSKAKHGTYCCGFTFAVAMRAAVEAHLLDGKSVAQIRKFQQHWYAATPEAKEKQQIYALEWLGIGQEVPLLDAQPGDFIHLQHGVSSGHSVIFVRWIVENDRKTGLEYRGTQGSTNGIGNRIERFGDFNPERTYAGRLNNPLCIPASRTALNEK